MGIQASAINPEKRNSPDALIQQAGRDPRRTLPKVTAIKDTSCESNVLLLCVFPDMRFRSVTFTLMHQKVKDGGEREREGGRQLRSPFSLSNLATAQRFRSTLRNAYSCYHCSL